MIVDKKNIENTINSMKIKTKIKHTKKLNSK